MMADLVLRLKALEGMLTIALVLIGILIFQNVRTTRRLKRLDQMLRMLPIVARNDRRAA